MRPERINAIFNQIAEKYAGHRLSHQMVESMYKDISAVLRGLHKTENFLNASVDSGKKIIIVEDEETLDYLGLLPYLDSRLMNMRCDDEPYIVYSIVDDTAYPCCAVSYINLYNGSTTESAVGFDMKVHNIKTLGLYYPNTDEFKRVEGE